MSEQFENKERSSLWDWIRYFFGFYKNPPYIEERLKEADVRSALYLTVAVIGIEIWLLLRYVKRYVITGKCATIGVFFHYTQGYWMLLIASLAIFIYSALYMTGHMKKLRNHSRLFIFLYLACGVYFGVVQSFSDFSKGKMITCFLSMALYGTFIFVVRPFISILLMGSVGWGFVYLINHYAVDKSGVPLHMESGDLVNYTTFFISLIVLYITIYFQRYQDAQKAFRLEVANKTDALTGINNVQGMEEKSEEYLSYLLSQGKKPVFLVFNVKNFQTYNDRYGYHGGDLLLKNMARIISEVFEGEVYARHAADKFLVITDMDHAESRGRLVKRRLQELYASEIYLDVKVGAFQTTDPTVSPRNAMDRARYAMNRMKNREDIFIAEYDEENEKDYILRHHILNSIETAVRDGYIQPYYQPVMDARDGSLCGCEALSRWIDPELGFLSPGAFIPILEESRQIHKLDRCIMESVLRQMRSTLDAGGVVLPVSLNFSRLDFELMDAVGELDELMKKYEIPKEFIHVEITESALTENEEELHQAVDRLHDMGYVVWLDDFGSGYSSLNVLKDFRFDLLKIDMVFLKAFSGNENSKVIIRSIIELANSLHMKTLTEGVETDEAVEFLKESGCERLQGYYYGKPQTYEEISAKIKTGAYQISQELQDMQRHLAK